MYVHSNSTTCVHSNTCMHSVSTMYVHSASTMCVHSVSTTYVCTVLALRVQYYFVNAVLVLVRVCTMITVVHA